MQLSKISRHRILAFSRIFNVNIVDLTRLIEDVRLDDIKNELKSVNESNNILSFITHCCDTMTTEQLQNAHIDIDLCRNWGLTSGEYQHAIETAKRWKIYKD